VVFVVVVQLVAWLVVLPGADVSPYGHVFFLGWLLWRSHALACQVRRRRDWTRPHQARPLATMPHPQGFVVGDGFLWVGEHVDAIQRYIHQYHALPQDPGPRGGSPAIHGCGAHRDRVVILPYERLASHVAIEGSTQSGKTVLLAHLARQAIACHQGAVVIMDPKGSDHLYNAAQMMAARCGRPFALIRPRTPEASASFNVLSSCREPTDLPGRLRPLFPEGREAYFKEEPLSLLLRVAGMHQALGIAWDIRHLHRDVMDVEALRWTLARYLQHLGAEVSGLQRTRTPNVSTLKTKYLALTIHDPFVPGVLRPLERTQEAHQDRFGNLDVALSGIVDVVHASLFGADDALTWETIDREHMVVVCRTDSLTTQQIGRNIASLFFQDFIGYMGLRYLTPDTKRRPITLIVDEIGEIVYPDFRQAINKVGEAGGRLILAWQSESDLDAALGKDEAKVIRANCQTRITMRIADGDTAATLATQSPCVLVTKVTADRATVMGGRSGKGITVENEEVQLLDANILHGQPVGQCFVRLDGALYHVNIPTASKGEHDDA
jgi:hypothetical protein